MNYQKASFIIILVFSLFIFWLWRLSSPYPAILNWDIFEHQTVINGIRAGQWALLPSGLTDTFRIDGYTTVFHTMIAAVQQIFKQDIVDFWRTAEFFHFLFIVTLSYATAVIFLRSTIAGILGVIIGATIFESQVAYTGFFLIPQTSSAILGVSAILLAIHPATRYRWISITSLIYLSLLTHFVVGVYALFLLLLTLLVNKQNELGIRRFSYALPVLLLFIGWIIAKFPGIYSLNYGEAFAFTHSLGQKFSYFRSWYGASIILIPIGLFLSLRGTKIERILGLLTVVSVAILLTPLPYVLKFAVIGRFFINTTIVVSLLHTVRILHKTAAKIAAVGVISITFIVIFVNNIQSWKTPLTRNGVASELSNEELSAAQFLNQTFQTHRHVMLLSDPATQYVLEALSTINSQGGAYADSKTRSAAAGLITIQNSSDLIILGKSITDNLDPAPPNRLIIILSGRYFRWMENPDYHQSVAFNIWRPEGLTLEDLTRITAFETRTGLVPIFVNADLVIYDLPLTGGTI
jgi:hypothetical protein